MIETRTSLLRRVRDPTDAQSWREFTDLYEPLLLGYVRGAGLTEHDARDVVQDVFTHLLKSVSTYDRQKAKFRSWLWRVTMNAIADWGRANNRRLRAEKEWAHRLCPAENQEPDADWDSAYHRRVLAFALEKVREQAQPNTWKCFEERVLRDPPRLAKEIAAELDVGETAVYMNAKNVFDRVQQLCAEYLEEGQQLGGTP